MSTPNRDDDMDSLAAEYVLGTLDEATYAQLTARRATDNNIDQTIRNWEQRLAPLALSIKPVEPRHELFNKLMQRIDALNTSVTGNNVVDLMLKLQRWRRLAITTSALAASLLVLVGLHVLRPAQPDQFVAVLQQSDTSPAFLVSVDLKSRELTIRSVTAPPQQGKSYELWIVNDKLGAPRSLGVVDTQGVSVHRALARYDTTVVRDAVYAISLEPEGGSPTGHATGPVLYTGKLVELTM